MVFWHQIGTAPPLKKLEPEQKFARGSHSNFSGSVSVDTNADQQSCKLVAVKFYLFSFPTIFLQPVHGKHFVRYRHFLVAS